MGLSTFEGRSFAAVVGEDATHEKALYLDDEIPWVVGYSGGKDSTATLQLIWLALRDLILPRSGHKPVHVISTDTLVENPVVAAWVNRSLEVLGRTRTSRICRSSRTG